MSDKLNLIDTIAKDDKFSTFTRLMRTSNTNDVFNGEGPFTVFVPTNDAFAKIAEAKINELINEEGQTKLKDLLSYHILKGKVMAANLTSVSSRKAFTGQELMFTDVNGLKVNSASIQARNLEATNGVIHALDTVLTPSTEPRPTSVTTAPLTTPTVTETPAAAAATASASANTPTAGTDKTSGNSIL